MVAKIASPSDLDAILRGILAQLAGSSAAGDRELTGKEKELFPLVTQPRSDFSKCCLSIKLRRRLSTPLCVSGKVSGILGALVTRVPI